MDLEGKGCSIFIFVSNDTDSLSSLKILTVSQQTQYFMNKKFRLCSNQTKYSTLLFPFFLTSTLIKNCRKLKTISKRKQDI